MTERLRYVAAVCIWMLPVLLVSISTVSIGKNPSRDDEELDYQEYLQLSEEERKALPLAEKLRLARPAPTSAPSGVRNQSDEPEQLQSIQSGADQASDVEQGTIDPAPMHSSSQYVPEVNGSTLRGSFEEGATEPGSFLSGQRITPTPPEPEYNSYSFPRSSFSKMLMGFSGYYYHCSATLVDRYFLFTAGHCIYNHDPNDDGNMSDAQWADEVWVFPGQTVFEPLRVDHPFGEAEWLELYAYSGWTDNANINYDQAFMRIDRPMGDWTGWMGYETNNPVGSLNFSGYPVETPYVPAGTHVQYRGFDSGNVSGYTQERIQMDAFVYGGHSGGPVWRYNSDNDNRRLQGMNSTSDREGYAEAARITNQVFNDLQSEIDEPHGQTLRPDIAHCTSPGCLGTKVLHDTQAEPGDSISFGFNVSNLGFESSSEILVDFYLVYSFAAHDFNYPPSSADVYLGSTTLSPLAPFTHVAPDISFTVPDTTAEGLRNVAWIAYQADPDVSEYYSGTSTACAPYCNNSAVIEGQTLAVERLPELTLSPRLIEFGDVTSGGSSPTRYVQIENQGTGHLTIDEIEIDTNGNHFMVVEDDCSSTSLGPEGEPNNSCVFGIVFAPGASGVHDAMVAIISNDSGSPQSVVLRGTSDVQFFNGFERQHAVVIPIADNGYDGSLASMACDTITIDDSGVVTDVDVTMAVDHTWIGDLTVKLVSPAGTVNTLMSRPGVAEPSDDGDSSAGFGHSDDLQLSAPITISTSNGVFDAEQMGGDGGDNVVCADDGECAFVPNPDTGPGGPLDSFFDGETAGGNWKLCVGDSASADSGHVSLSNSVDVSTSGR